MALIRSNLSDPAVLIDVIASANDPENSPSAMTMRRGTFGLSVMAESTIAGSLTILQYIGPDDPTAPQLLDEDNFEVIATQALAAATFIQFDVPGVGVLPIRASYNPDSQPHTTKVTIQGYGGK